MRRRKLIIALSSVSAWPHLATAEKPAKPAIGYLSSASQVRYPAELLAAFRQGLADTGLRENQDVSIEYRWAEDRYDTLPSIAESLVRSGVSVIVATGGIVTARAARAATSTIPIVFTVGDDPVEAGLVKSFARPDGNLTGVSFFAVELGQKLVQLAAELVHDGSAIAMLANPNRPSYKAVRDAAERAADTIGRAFRVVDAGNESDFDAAFAPGSDAGVVIVTSDPLYLDRRQRLIDLAARRSMPAVYAWRECVISGGLLSYGVSLPDIYRQAGIYAGRIVQGAKPQDLPVIQPTAFKLTINLKTARNQGIKVPEAILYRADETLE
jgi:putative ABC transport system substrate-binding protein